MNSKGFMILNRILLGLVMLVPGIMKLLDPSFVAGMLSGIGLFSWAPTFWTWVLIFAELIAGILILLNRKIEYGAWIAAVVLVVAAFTVHLNNPGNMLIHLALASNFLVWATKMKK